MKRLLIILMVSILLITFTQIAWCADAGAPKQDNSAAETDDSVHATIGITSWFLSISESNNSITVLKPEFLLGPRISISYKGFFVGGTYLGDISNELWLGTTTTTLANPPTDDDHVTRNILNLIAGYMINPNVGIFVGELYLKTTQTYQSPSTNTVWGGTSSNSNVQEGPGLGITTNLPVNDNIGLYANAAFMFATFQWSGFPSYTRDTLTLDGGVNIRIIEKMTANIGWKEQINYFEGSDSSSQGIETLSGPTFGLAYSF